MKEVEEHYEQTKQVWSIVRHKDNVDLDIITLQIFEANTDEILLDMSWNAKDFFKQMVDLQYEYGK
jgi:hypothetical protein